MVRVCAERSVDWCGGSGAGGGWTDVRRVRKHVVLDWLWENEEYEALGILLVLHLCYWIDSGAD